MIQPLSPLITAPRPSTGSGVPIGTPGRDSVIIDYRGQIAGGRNRNAGSSLARRRNGETDGS